MDSPLSNRASNLLPRVIWGRLMALFVSCSPESGEQSCHYDDCHDCYSTVGAEELGRALNNFQIPKQRGLQIIVLCPQDNNGGIKTLHL